MGLLIMRLSHSSKACGTYTCYMYYNIPENRYLQVFTHAPNIAYILR